MSKAFEMKKIAMQALVLQQDETKRKAEEEYAKIIGLIEEQAKFGQFHVDIYIKERDYVEQLLKDDGFSWVFIIDNYDYGSSNIKSHRIYWN